MEHTNEELYQQMKERFGKHIADKWLKKISLYTDLNEYLVELNDLLSSEAIDISDTEVQKAIDIINKINELQASEYTIPVERVISDILNIKEDTDEIH